MAYTEKTTTSYGKRLGNSFKGIFSGIIFFLLGTVALFWNEGNFVKTKKALDEGQRIVVELNDNSTLNNQYNGKLVHTSGFADTKDSLTDVFLGVKDLAIGLHRKVEYYQWVEKSKSEKKQKLGGGEETITTYTYQREWTSAPVNSENFKDVAYKGKNMILAQVENKSVYAENVSFGAYKLPEFIIHSIQEEVPVNVQMTEEEIKNLDSKLNKKQYAAINSIEQTSNSTNIIHIHNHVTYLGNNTSNPQVGDVRITLVKTPPTTISLLAKVNGNTFEPFFAKNGKRISQVAQGTVSAENMFSSAHSSNSMLTWLFRLLGFILVFVGLRSMFGFLEMLFKFIPFLANMVGSGLSIILLGLGLGWSLLIISISWLFYRPLIAIVLIGIAIGLLFLLKRKTTAPKEVVSA